MTSHMTDHVIIRFIILQLPFLLDVSSNKYVDIWDYDFVNKVKSF